MTTTWQALLWKEWREHRWLMAFLAVATTLLVPWLWLNQFGPSWLEMLGPLLVMVIPLVSIFLGANIAASEYGNRTIWHLQALPESLGRAAGAKLLLALVTVWVPCVELGLVGSIAQWLNPSWRPSPSLLEAVLLIGMSTSSLLIWTAAFGVNQSDSVRAGAVGLLVNLTCLVLIATLAYDLLTIHPLGIWVYSAGGDWRPTTVAIALLSHGALMAWYIVRFGQVRRSRASDGAAPTEVKKTVGWLAPPRQSRSAAVLWKQMRETLPLAALGAGSIFAVTVLLAVGLRDNQDEAWGIEVAYLLAATWAMTGFFVAIVAGIGVFMDDLRPELHTFWRSRPINPNHWFLLKFFPALVATTLTMALPVLVVLAALASLGASTDLGTGRSGDGLAALAGIGLGAQSAAFCLAAAAIAVTRRPVLAAIVTILAAVALAIAAAGIGAAIGVPLTACLLATLTGVAAAVIAWIAIRFDLGWKA